MTEKENIQDKEIESVLHFECGENPQQPAVELIKYKDGTGKISCNLYRTKNCDHSCVYSYVYRLAPKGLV